MIYESADSGNGPRFAAVSCEGIIIIKLLDQDAQRGGISFRSATDTHE